MDVLPQSVYDDIAGMSPTVTLPPGRWQLPQPLRVKRGNVHISGAGCVLVPAEGQSLPVWIGNSTVGGLIYWGNQDGRRLAEGVCTPDADTFTVADVDGIEPGNVVLLGLGVNVSDPAGPECIRFREVAEVNGNQVRFTQPLGVATRVYSSFDELRALTTDPGGQPKIGPWGWDGVSGHISRGLGTSHDLFCFEGGKPVQNVIVDGLAIDWPEDARAYGTAAFNMNSTRNVECRNIEINNPTGTSLHMVSSEQSGFDRVLFTGYGRSMPFGLGTIEMPADLCSMWGGYRCHYKRITSVASNVKLTNFELGSNETLVDDVVLVTGPQSFPSPHFGVWGPHPDCTFRNILLDLPPQALFNYIGSNDAPPFALHNVTLRRPEFPEWFPFGFDNLGSIRIGDRTFGPLQTIERTFTATASKTFHAPPGLYKSARIILESRDNIRAILAGAAEEFLNQPGLVIEFRHQYWRWAVPLPLAVYESLLDFTVYLTQPPVPTTFRFQAECYPG